MNKPELLAPAGNLEKLKTAIEFGADAVYLGGSKLNLRAYADNFTTEQLKEGIEFAHSIGKKVHVTLNIIPHDSDLEGIEEYLKELYELGIDAAIIADPGIMTIAKKVVPNLEIHLSTQASCLNYEMAKFWHNFGVKRVVTAREMTLKELKEMREKLPDTCEIESFIHGSMCMAYSGKCMLSNYLTGRDPNRGACAQPCRYKYHLYEEDGNELIEKTDEGSGTYIMNSRDLCMIEYLPSLIEAGINSFKIEGRMKSVYYVASVVKAYRQAIDTYFENPKEYKFNPKWMEYLVKPSHREFTTGFYFDEEVKQSYGSSSYIRAYEIVGIVKDYDSNTKVATIQEKNKVYNGETVELLALEGDDKLIELKNMKNADGDEIETANVPEMIFTIECELELKKDDILIKNLP
ncbi:Putative protease, family U32 [Clostridium neonatale]|uniref:peptidase U32 family protein n=1 Tax=Clostridium neonatale TaxID=137838 RepID=UPI001D2B7EC0|nr:U32 family peptidase [Clostridium neonatale]CAG9711618.1 Putative protease, family U32 [Clostridium neonatale]